MREKGVLVFKFEKQELLLYVINELKAKIKAFPISVHIPALKCIRHP